MSMANLKILMKSWQKTKSIHLFIFVCIWQKKKVQRLLLWYRDKKCMLIVHNSVTFQGNRQYFSYNNQLYNSMLDIKQVSSISYRFKNISQVITLCIFTFHSSFSKHSRTVFYYAKASFIRSLITVIRVLLFFWCFTFFVSVITAWTLNCSKRQFAFWVSEADCDLQ